MTGLVIVVGATPTPFGPPLLPPQGFTLQFTVPAGLDGSSVLFQGAVLTSLAANGIFAVTDGQEFAVTSGPS